MENALTVYDPIWEDTEEPTTEDVIRRLRPFQQKPLKEKTPSPSPMKVDTPVRASPEEKPAEADPIPVLLTMVHPNKEWADRFKILAGIAEGATPIREQWHTLFLHKSVKKPTLAEIWGLLGVYYFIFYFFSLLFTMHLCHAHTYNYSFLLHITFGHLGHLIPQSFAKSLS